MANVRSPAVKIHISHRTAANDGVMSVRRNARKNHVQWCRGEDEQQTRRTRTGIHSGSGNRGVTRRRRRKLIRQLRERIVKARSIAGKLVPTER